MRTSTWIGFWAGCSMFQMRNYTLLVSYLLDYLNTVANYIVFQVNIEPCSKVCGHNTVRKG